MRTTKTLLALIAAAAMVACSKDDISYGDLDGTYEMTKIIYSFDGETVAEATPSSADWDDLLDWYWEFDKMKFEGNNVVLYEYGYTWPVSYSIDNGHLLVIDYIFKIEKKGSGFSIISYPYFDDFEFDSNYNPIYEEDGPIDFESLEMVDVFNGTEIFDWPYHYGYLYSKDGKPVSCDQYSDDCWYDRIEFIYKKK